MQKHNKKKSAILLFALTLILSVIFCAPQALAISYSGDLSINEKDIRFSTDNFLEGREIRIYATTTSFSDKDLLGVVRFFDNGEQIQGDQAISIFAHKTDDVFIDWIPSYGNHRVAVKIFPWIPEIDNPDNNWIATETYVVQDTDHDGISNDKDTDDDGDGVLDTEDAFPLNSNEQLDTDGDGTGNNTDLDDDNDDVPDKFDDVPLDPNETTDTDKDGIGNNADTDDDGDGLSDISEENGGTNPIKADTDGDGSNDLEDAFPLDPKESLDTDKDKIGNNIDTDDDNDSIPDSGDKFPLNKAPVINLNNVAAPKSNNAAPTETITQTIGLLEDTTFDASDSYDEDGKIVSYVWEIDGKTEEGNAITHAFETTGEHNVKLTITDDSGESKTVDLRANVLNIRLYKQTVISLMVIFLAMLIFFKYISKAKKHKDKHNQ